jgi:hypothetical protein
MRKKGIKTTIVGIILFVSGTFLIPAKVVIPAIFGGPEAEQFVVPGTLYTKVTEPGRYYLWNDHITVYKGKSYNGPASLPDGLEIKIFDSAGKEIDFKTKRSITVTNENSTKKSIGFVDLDSPVDISVSVTGRTDKLIFSFSQSIIQKVVSMIFGAIGVSALLSVLGILFLIVGLVRMVNDQGEPVGGADSTR